MTLTNDLQQSVDALLAYQRVHAWSAQQQGEIGLSVMAWACPFAKYLNLATQEEWAISSCTARNLTTKQRANLPLWVVEAIGCVDNLGEWIEIVTAEQFRQIVERCKPQENEP